MLISKARGGVARGFGVSILDGVETLLRAGLLLGDDRDCCRFFAQSSRSAKSSYNSAGICQTH
jgi:hypothetical protein